MSSYKWHAICRPPYYGPKKKEVESVLNESLGNWKNEWKIYDKFISKDEMLELALHGLYLNLNRMNGYHTSLETFKEKLEDFGIRDLESILESYDEPRDLNHACSPARTSIHLIPSPTEADSVQEFDGPWARGSIKSVYHAAKMISIDQETYKKLFPQLNSEKDFETTCEYVCNLIKPVIRKL